MKRIFNLLYQNHRLLYKVFLFIITTFLIVYLFPTVNYFKYDIQKGKIWQFQDYRAPFDFALQKSEKDILSETEKLTNTKQVFYSVNKNVKKDVYQDINDWISLNTSVLSDQKREEFRLQGVSILNKIYKNGYIQDKVVVDHVTLLNGNQASSIKSSHLFNDKKIEELLQQSNIYFIANKDTIFLKDILKNKIKPNITFNEKFTNKMLKESINRISYTKGKINKDDLIIKNGDIQDEKKFEILQSLKNEFKNHTLDKTNYYWTLFGYTILIALVLMMLLLFLWQYRIAIFDNNNKLTFIFFNILLMVFLTTITIKYKTVYLYAVPLIILPIVIKAFFDSRLGLFTHVLTILLLGFIVPNSFEFIFLQIIAGIVTILTVSELYKRAYLFISIAKITGVYILAYFAFIIIQEGNALHINPLYFVLFILNGILALLAQYLIWVYEKIFGLVSDVSLLELANTNSKLLRELNEKAPGTFQHSMQVANIAEASAIEIGANAMLVRAGALYHDIGKMIHPMYFTENQSTSVSPHNDLSPKDSAKIIINHVIDGIELAKKHKLPDHLIDFIRTHHGTSLVYYFYKLQEQIDGGEVDKKEFQYPGPIPFSKETAILMMADASEAASKSLKEPNAQAIDVLIDKVIDGQMNLGQFMNSNITFKEIQIIKKVIKKKLMNIYHVRIEYPE